MYRPADGETGDDAGRRACYASGDTADE